jgi:hypothetical protein
MLESSEAEKARKQESLEPSHFMPSIIKSLYPPISSHLEPLAFKGYRLKPIVGCFHACSQFLKIISGI